MPAGKQPAGITLVSKKIMAMSNAERQALFTKRKKSAGINDKMIQIRMHATCPVEMQIFESWKNESDKKMLFIKLYTDYLATKKPTD